MPRHARLMVKSKWVRSPNTGVTMNAWLRGREEGGYVPTPDPQDSPIAPLGTAQPHSDADPIQDLGAMTSLVDESSLVTVACRAPVALTMVRRDTSEEVSSLGVGCLDVVGPQRRRR